MSGQQEPTHPHRRAMLAFLFAIGLTTAALGDTKSVEMKFSDPMTAGKVTISFNDTATGRKARDDIEVDIPDPCNAEQKEELISAKLTSKGITNVRSLSGAGLTMTAIDTKIEVGFDNGGTAEHDVIQTEGPTSAGVHFSGFFEPFDVNRQPAVFTAGIVTDVGELSATISAQELNFQTDGPIICQALFQRLAPRAPQFGAQINYAGDRLEVYFDPAFTVNAGGVDWGTTSPSAGCGGSLLIENPELTLTVDPLRAGASAAFSASGAVPRSTVYFYYSLRGIGDTYLANLNVTLDLLSPVTIGSARANSEGVARLTRTVPANSRGVTVYMQAAANEDLSQVVIQRVQ